ncbi:MAG: SEC-C metal-binding domain-containing protein, partial [Tepidisphaeraceae bacterium]
VSLDDELMKLFAGEWVYKVLGWLGMEEGMAIEDKRISKGILRAQKKVEERNFLARKNLLEYDEVMNHQRTIFYGMRQQVLEGRDVGQVIWDMIGDAINDAVDKYITLDFVAANVAEWARVNFDVTLDPGDFKGYRKYEDIEPFIKDQAKAEASTTINATLAEFTGEIEDDRTAWDTKGLQSWAMSRFQVNLSQAQIRSMDYHELEDKLRISAEEQIDKRDCAGITRYLEELYAETELANWAREKFGAQITPKELLASDKGGRNTRKGAEEIVELMESRARAAYQTREIEYPVDYILALVMQGRDAGTIEDPNAAEYLRGWIKLHYDVDVPLSHIQSTPLHRLRDEMMGYQKEWMSSDNVNVLADHIMEENPTPAGLALALRQRFGVALTEKDLQQGTEPGKTEARVPDADADGSITPRDTVVRAVRNFLRKELTDLEQFVLIQILDQSWKDHLYAMDMLRNSVGLQAFAEKDPRIAYKKDGFRYFEEMMVGVRDKVTDLIFRVQVQGPVRARSAYNVTSATHEETDAYGVAENMQQVPGPEAQQVQAEGGEGEGGAVVKTIVREAEKVGRNDPCPCGSGKKYKKCCGTHMA